MKRILYGLFLMLFILTGCDNLMNTPTKKVENLLSKYQKNDSVVIGQLGDVLLENEILNVNQKDVYKQAMERQYSNLMYKIKNEAIDGKTAVVEVEIEVYDYNKAIVNTENELLKSPEKFQDETGNVNTGYYNDYKLEQIKNMNDRVTYTINFTLTKVDDTWVVDDLTEAERMKIHGIYPY